jgi:hypothetical protein
MKANPSSVSGGLHAFKPGKAWAFQLVKSLVLPRHSFRQEAAQKSGRFLQVSPPDLNPLLKRPSTSLFVWVPKTAGTAIFRWVASQSVTLLVKDGENLLDQWDDRSEWDMVAFGSMNIDALVKAKYFDPFLLQSRYSFAFVRNPYARIASLFRYALKMGAVPKKTPFRVFLWMVARQQPMPGLYNWSGLSMASPMVNWIQQQTWAGPKQIFRVEDGASAFRQLGENLGLRGLPGRENETSATLAPVRFRKFEIDLIQDIFFEDFKEFGYSPEPPE